MLLAMRDNRRVPRKVTPNVVNQYRSPNYRVCDEAALGLKKLILENPPAFPGDDVLEAERDQQFDKLILKLRKRAEKLLENR